MNIVEMRISALRTAIQSSQVSFPSQTPCFNQSRADIQWRLVQLYFIRGWNCFQLARRYKLTRQRIEQLLAQWVERASKLGYLQEIPPPVEIGAIWQSAPGNTVYEAERRRPISKRVDATEMLLHEQPGRTERSVAFAATHD